MTKTELGNKQVNNEADPLEIINAYEGWGLYNSLKKKKKLGSKLVAVMDTMFYDKHPDLYGILKSDTDYLAETSHGTHVAGIIGARGGEVKGVFPDAQIIGKSLTTKFLMPIYNINIKDQKIEKSALIADYAVNKALKSLVNSNNKLVINCSFGYNTFLQKLILSNSGLINSVISYSREKRNSILLNALNKGKDFLIVQSSGNFSFNKNFAGKYIDAYYSSHFVSSHPEIRDRIITVGAVKDENTIWQSSQLGSGVDILAPGYKINSTISLEETLNQNLKGKYARLTGTSMAAPFVSGSAAILWYIYPNLKGPEIKKILVNSANDIYNSYDYRTYKLLNLYQALRYAEYFGENPYIKLSQ